MKEARLDRRLIAGTAVAMYGGAGFLSVAERILAGGSSFSVAPGAIALVVVVLLIWHGERLPRPALAALGPVGVALIATALATTPGPGDGAVLYAWPVVWTAYFYGRPGTVGILGAVAAAHTIVLLALPTPGNHFGRWLDVMTVLTVLAVVVRGLADRNDGLVRQLAQEARIDPLSGLLNRRGFNERAEVELARARRQNTPIAIAAIDIDRLKSLNDDWGHEVGDHVIAHLGSVLRAEARDVDVLARIGGDEFIALLSGPEHSAGAFAARVRDALSTDLPTAVPPYTISAGIAAQSMPCDLTSLLARADSALYAAKAAGRNRIEVAATPHNLT